MQNDWLLDVLKDLEDFCLKNSLLETAQQLESSIKILSSSEGYDTR